MVRALWFRSTLIDGHIADTMLLQAFSYATAVVCALHGDLIGQQRVRVDTGPGSVSGDEGRVGE